MSGYSKVLIFSPTLAPFGGAPRGRGKEDENRILRAELAKSYFRQSSAFLGDRAASRSIPVGLRPSLAERGKQGDGVNPNDFINTVQEGNSSWMQCCPWLRMTQQPPKQSSLDAQAEHFSSRVSMSLLR